MRRRRWQRVERFWGFQGLIGRNTLAQMRGENHEKISLRFGVHRLFGNSECGDSAVSRHWLLRSWILRPWIHAPGYTAPGYTTPGYMWREQRLNEERRTNPQLRETYENQRTPNNTIGSGSIGVTDPNAVGGECAKGFSEETCRRRGQTYNPPRQN